jgi:hypothetical protein
LLCFPVKIINVDFPLSFLKVRHPEKVLAVKIERDRVLSEFKFTQAVGLQLVGL